MRCVMLACQVLFREVNYLAALSGTKLNISWLPQGLHDTPATLRNELSQRIAEVEHYSTNSRIEPEIDAILLGYALCGGGVAGICSGSIPLVVPKADDCISLFLGSRQAYYDYFRSLEGIYWYTPGWIEHAFTPSKESYEQKRQEYMERYGEENASFLIEEENNWIRSYQNCIYIRSPIVENGPYRAHVKQCSQDFGWSFAEAEGNLRLLKNLIDGNWDSKDFLVCPPFHQIVETYDEQKIKAVPIES